CSCLCCETCYPLTFYPVIGGGVGVNQLTIFNFRSIGLPPVDPLLSPAPGFAAENEFTRHYHVAYQALAGLEFRYCNNWAITMGYRWFDGGKFRGPRFFRDEIGHAADVQGDTWKIKFRANEVFLELKLYI